MEVGRGELNRVLQEAIGTEPFELLLATPGPVRRAHAATAGHAFVAATLATAIEAPVLAIAHDPHAADVLASGAATFLGADRVVRFPAWESLPYEGISPTPQVAGARARAAHLLRGAAGPMVVAAPVLAAIQGLVPTLGDLEPLVLQAETTLPPDVLAERLVASGYSRVDVVEHRGEFAVRGGIVDLFPSTSRRPVRLDYFGDAIESLREFAPATQLSTSKVERVEVYPCRELVVTDEVRRRADLALALYRGQYAALLERLAQGLAFEGMEQAVSLIYDRLPMLSDLLPPAGWIVVATARRTADRAARILEEADALAEASAWPGPRSVRELEAALGARQRVEISD